MSRADDSTIQRLLDRASNGDDSAYAEIIQLSAQQLQILASRMLKNYPRLRRWEETGDIFQSAAIRLHRSLSSVKPTTTRDFFGLAVTQLRRTLIDLARHHFGPLGHAANHQSDFGDRLQAGLIDRASALDDEPDSLQSWANFHQRVGELPADERHTFELIWYGGLPQADVATVLGVSIPTVKRRLRSARLLLAKYFSDSESDSQNAK